MALSWSELSTDQKIVHLIESLAEKQDQQTPIACSLCDQIFFDNRSLLNHFQSHFHRGGAFNPRPLVGSSVSPENGTNFFSSSSQYIPSLSVPVNLHATVNETLTARAWQAFAPNPSNPLQGNYPLGTLLQNSVQLRGPTLAHRPQSYTLPSILRSAISNGTLASPSNVTSNFYARLFSQLAGPQNFRSAIRPVTSGIFTSQTTQQSNIHLPMNPTTSASQTAQLANFHFLINPGRSASQPNQHSSFYPPVAVGAVAVQSIPGTSGLALNTTTRNHPQRATENEVEGLSTGYTKPYITQLEQSIAEVVEDHNDMDVDVNPDAVDLTLKL